MKKIPRTKLGNPAIPLVARDLKAIQEFEIQYYDNTLCSETVPSSLISYLESHDKITPNKRNQTYSTIVYKYSGDNRSYRERYGAVYLIYHYFLLNNSGKYPKAAIFTGDDIISKYSITQVSHDPIRINPLEIIYPFKSELDKDSEEITDYSVPKFAICTSFPIIKFHSICLYRDPMYKMHMHITKHIMILRDDFPYHLSLINLGLSNQHTRSLILQRVQETLVSKSTQPEIYTENTFNDLYEGFLSEENSSLFFFKELIHYSIWYLDGCPDNVPKYGGEVYEKLISSQSSSNPLISKLSFIALSSYYRKLVSHLLNFLEDF